MWYRSSWTPRHHIGLWWFHNSVECINMAKVLLCLNMSLTTNHYVTLLCDNLCLFMYSCTSNNDYFSMIMYWSLSPFWILPMNGVTTMSAQDEPNWAFMKYGAEVYLPASSCTYKYQSCGYLARYHCLTSFQMTFSHLWNWCHIWNVVSIPQVLFQFAHYEGTYSIDAFASHYWIYLWRLCCVAVTLPVWQKQPSHVNSWHFIIKGQSFSTFQEPSGILVSHQFWII